MKLLFIQPTGDKYGHFGVYITKLAQELSLRGNEVIICTNKLNIKNFIEKPLFRTIEVGNGKYEFEHIDRFAKEKPIQYWFSYFRNSWVVMRAALKLTISNKFDGIYITDVEFLVASVTIKLHKHSTPPIIMQVNASNFSYADYAGNFLKKFYKVVQREIFRRIIGCEISAFSILGEWHRSRLLSQLRISPTFPIVLIPDGAGEKYETISREAARQKLGIEWNGDVLLFMGILRRDKGLEELATALRELWSKRKDFRVILSGFPFEYSRQEIEQLFYFRAENSPICFKYLDYVSEELVPIFYSASDALLLPYNKNYNGSSGPLMKGACTFGLPAIVSDISEMGIQTRQNKIGFVCNPSDAKSLESAINDFLNVSLAQRAEIRASALNLGESNSWQMMACKYENAFKRLLKNKLEKIN